MIGVDEAGKGAVLGSMFVAAVQLQDGFSRTEELRDSKLLDRAVREELASDLESETRYAVVEIPPDEVDRYVRDGGMNDLVVKAHARAVKKLGVEGVVVADASDVSAERFASRLSRLSGWDEGRVMAEHHADENHGCVAAASILAKVRRDQHVEGYGCGSGYPGDPHTQQFLDEYVRRNGCLPPYARSSWKTSQRVLESVDQKGLDEF